MLVLAVIVGPFVFLVDGQAALRHKREFDSHDWDTRTRSIELHAGGGLTLVASSVRLTFSEEAWPADKRRDESWRGAVNFRHWMLMPRQAVTFVSGGTKIKLRPWGDPNFWKRLKMALGFEAKQNLVRVKTSLDELEGNASSNGLRLRRFVNVAVATLAELADDGVAADGGAGFELEVGRRTGCACEG